MQLQTFDADIGHFDPRTPHAGDDKLPIKFSMGAVQNDAKSEKEGRPIFDDMEFIDIFVSKDHIICRPVRDSDRQRWPRQYQAWKLTGESSPGASGTRLEYWPPLTRAQVEEFKYFKIFTVEQLAEAPDNNLQNIPGVQRLKALAKVHVETAKGELPLLKMQLELEARDGQIAELNSEVRRISKLLENMAKTP